MLSRASFATAIADRLPQEKERYFRRAAEETAFPRCDPAFNSKNKIRGRDEGIEAAMRGAPALSL